MITAMLLTNETIKVILDNGADELVARNDHPRWPQIIEAAKLKNEKALRDLVKMANVIDLYSVGNLKIQNNAVLYCGIPMHGVDVDRVLAFMRDHLPYEPLANYINRKMKNPDPRSIQEMYNFHEHKGMPLTDDGYFIGYKGIGLNDYSIRGGNEPLESGMRNSEGQIYNYIGQEIRMVRSYVDTNYNNGCGHGLHVGSLEYALGWGQKVVLVKVDPADVVSVPNDCECQKMRVCAYTVIGEYAGKLPDAYTPEFSSKKDEHAYTDGHSCCGNSDCDCEEDDNCPLCGAEDCSCEHNRCLSCGHEFSDCTCPESLEAQEQHCVSTCECSKHNNTPVSELEEVAQDAGILSPKNEPPHYDEHEDKYLDGMKDGIDDKASQVSPKYLAGDQKGADSPAHADYIDGYIDGYAD